jgi:hypothetical protein
MHPRVRITLSAVWLASAPFFGASADPPPSPSESASASPPPAPLSAALFARTTAAPPEDAWKQAEPIAGVRMGNEARGHGCQVTHVAEWVRVRCDRLVSVRVDVLAGEKRDFSVLAAGHDYEGDRLLAQFSMRRGDRRVIQWIAPDLWEDIWPGDNGDWMTGGSQPIGPMYGVAVQVDWASGDEPLILVF